MLQTGILSAMVCFQSLSYGVKAYPCTHFRSARNYACVRDSSPHPAWKDHSIYLYRPEDTGKYPVIFFCHGITAENPELYGSLIRHMVGRGYAVVYVPYPSSKAYLWPRSTYRTIWKGFRKSVDQWDEWIDLDSVGFVGHSYGGGAVPSLAHKAIVENGWGRTSAFLYIMAPWYVHGITQRKLRYFPRQVKMVVEVFADDKINDHRIAKDVYLSVGIADSAKVFCTFSTTPGALSHSAGHDLPMGESGEAINVDDGDFSGVYFVFDALSAYARNPLAGCARFRHENMVYALDGPSGKKAFLTIERHPVMCVTQSICLNFWEHCMNPRRGLYRIFTGPLRMLVATPETVLYYGKLGCCALGAAVINQ